MDIAAAILEIAWGGAIDPHNAHGVFVVSTAQGISSSSTEERPLGTFRIKKGISDH